MRILAIILVLLFCVLQYDLWIGEGSLATVSRLQKKISAQKDENKKISEQMDGIARPLEVGMEGYKGFTLDIKHVKRFQKIAILV